LPTTECQANAVCLSSVHTQLEFDSRLTVEARPFMSKLDIFLSPISALQHLTYLL